MLLLCIWKKMFCFSSRVTSTTVCVIIFLVISLIIYWTRMGASTDVHNGEELTSLNSTIIGSIPYQFVEAKKQYINNGVTPEYRSSSVLPTDQYKGKSPLQLLSPSPSSESNRRPHEFSTNCSRTPSPYCPIAYAIFFIRALLLVTFGNGYSHKIWL